MPTFEAHQEQDKSKAELGLTEEQVETLKQVSSLVGMFQQEALNEKQTRLLAQLKALEKVCALFFLLPVIPHHISFIVMSCRI